MLHGQQQEGRGMGQEGIRNMDKESQGELLLSEGPGTLSHGCSRKGSLLVYDKGSLCYTAGGFGKSYKMLAGRVSINELKPFLLRGV